MILSILFILLLFFFLGSSIASFLNLLVDRIVAGEQFIQGRSHCDYCQHKLAIQDLIPVLSYLFLGGKCRYCHKKLAPTYLFLEICTGVIYACLIYIALFFPTTIALKGWRDFLLWMWMSAACIAILYADIRYGIIPDIIVFPTLALQMALLLLQYSVYNPMLWLPFLAAGTVALLFLFIVIITRGLGMGLGDVKFSLVMGLFLGYPGIVHALYIAFLTGALAAVILILGKKKKLRQTIPFGPFLILGMFGAALFKEPFTAWWQFFIG